MIARRTTTMWTVADVLDWDAQGQLDLAPEFQRNSVWPFRAKSYFVDSLLLDRPVPVLMVERRVSAQTGLSRFSVIDGQQRLRSIIEFAQDRFRLVEASDSRWANKKFSALDSEDQYRLLNYALLTQIVEGYTDAEIRDIFVRLNRYVVRLAPQELRHARRPGQFADLVERLGALDYWSANRIFSANQISRMRPAEFAAELVILLLEGPQDKKLTVDLYYDYFAEAFPDEDVVVERLMMYLDWIASATDLPNSRFRRAVDFYGLVGALDRVVSDEDGPGMPDPDRARPLLEEFEAMTRLEEPPRDAARYLIAASRQTDNVGPRSTRIDALERVLRQA